MLRFRDFLFDLEQEIQRREYLQQCIQYHQKELQYFKEEFKRYSSIEEELENEKENLTPRLLQNLETELEACLEQTNRKQGSCLSLISINDETDETVNVARFLDGLFPKITLNKRGGRYRPFFWRQALSSLRKIDNRQKDQTTTTITTAEQEKTLNEETTTTQTTTKIVEQQKMMDEEIATTQATMAEQQKTINKQIIDQINGWLANGISTATVLLVLMDHNDKKLMWELEDETLTSMSLIIKGLPRTPRKEENSDEEKEDSRRKRKRKQKVKNDRGEKVPSKISIPTSPTITTTENDKEDDLDRRMRQSEEEDDDEVTSSMKGGV